MNVAKIYNRLPSDSGVTFKGFENIKLESREDAQKKLEEFMNYCESARKPSMRVILGEWGEGKTDAYRRYIEPRAKSKGHYTFFVSASTLANSYDLPLIAELLKSTPLSAVRFLVALFNAIREENKEEKIPSPQGYKDATSYLDAVLDNLLSENKSKRVFIFIDEFEELLLNPDKLKEIISGIKETINGMFREIDEGGKYEGCLHLIIAATPDAYFRLQTAEETSLIFGGLGRRADYIELRTIRKKEGIRFLYELLKYAYNDYIPQPLPIMNFGIFNLLYRISRGNPGTLVSLFARLMNSARLDDKSIKVIDYDHVLEFLRKEYIFVYGASTMALEVETYDRLLKIIMDQRRRDLGEKASMLIKLLLGELKPFSVNELGERIKYGDVKNLVAIINDNLKRREGIERAIIKVCPLRADKALRDVEMAFKDFVVERGDGKYLQIDAYSERWEDFEDKISYFHYENGNVVQRLYLPCDEQSIISFFEGITLDRAREIENIVRRRLCEDEPYYMASEELISQIFPTPIPRELDFIKDRRERLRLWRDVSRNLAKEYENYMPRALIQLFEESGIIPVTQVQCEPKSDNISACTVELKIGEMRLRALFSSVNGDVKGIDIDEIWNMKKKIRPPVHGILLIFTGDLTPEATEKIENKGIGKDGENIIIEVRLHPTLVKRLICLYKALKSSMPRDVINDNLLSLTINKILQYDLNIKDKIENWLKDQENRGVVVKLRITSTSNLREFADTLRFFINVTGQEKKLKEVFDRNQDLVKYTRFGAKKAGLIPDILFSKFEEITKDLVSNRFLEEIESELYRVKLHPVENRILKLLKEETKLSPDELEKFFIFENPRYFTDVFLPILEYKGLITKKDKYYCLTNRTELYNEVVSLYKRFTEISENYKQYGYIYMVKERGERLISLKDLSSFTESLYKYIQEMSELNEELELQKLSLMKRLMEHFYEELFPLVKEAKERGVKILTEAGLLENNARKLLDRIREECDKLFKIQFELEDVEEYVAIQENLGKVREYSLATDEKIKELVEGFELEDRKKFNFSLDEEVAFYFNPKVFMMSKHLEKAKQIMTEIEGKTDGLIKQLDELNSKREALKEKLSNIDEDSKGYKMSHPILKTLYQLSTAYPQLNPIKVGKVKLKELVKDYLESNIREFFNYIEELETCASSLNKLLNKEKDFVNLLDGTMFLALHVLSVFDIEDYNDDARKFADMVKSIMTQYEEFASDIQPKSPEDVKQIVEKSLKAIESFEDTLSSEKSRIYKKWEEYVKETKEFINNVEYTMKLLKQLIRNQEKVEEVKEKLNKLSISINVESVENFHKKLSELEEMKQEANNALYEALKDVLEKEELLLVEFIVKRIGGKKRAWLLLEEIHEFAKEKLRLDPSKTEETLRKLIGLNILKQGVTLASIS